MKEQKVYRIIDANCNRAKEGLRVCEDIARFILDHKKISSRYKNLRHTLEKSISAFPFKKTILIKAREIEQDVGRGSIGPELKRNTTKDIYFANSQRVKESIRVLEEFAKLKNPKIAQQFKTIRYRSYALEKATAKLL